MKKLYRNCKNTVSSIAHRHGGKIATGATFALMGSKAFAVGEDAAQTAIIAAGTTLAGYAAAAGAAGVAVFIVIMGIKAAKRGMKSAS